MPTTKHSIRRRWITLFPVITFAVAVAVGTAVNGSGNGLGQSAQAETQNVTSASTSNNPPTEAPQATTKRQGKLKTKMPSITGPSKARIYPFTRSRRQRQADHFDLLPANVFNDQELCSVACRPSTAINGWPLRPFHRQHPLRSGLNEVRKSSLHHGIDIQTRDGSRVYAIQPGFVRVIKSSGPEARLQVGNYIYWHLNAQVREGEAVTPYQTVLGTTKRGFGHLHFSEVMADGRYLNPLRPGGRVLSPYRDRYGPIIATPRPRVNGSSTIKVFDPQSFNRKTSYLTPVIAPAAVAFRLWNKKGRPLQPLKFILRGSSNLPFSMKKQIYTSNAHKADFNCFADHKICRPSWNYRLTTPRQFSFLATDKPAPRIIRLTVYAWDWANNASARDFWFKARRDQLSPLHARQAKRLERRFLKQHYRNSSLMSY